jgi:hypothetical protein
MCSHDSGMAKPFLQNMHAVRQSAACMTGNRQMERQNLQWPLILRKKQQIRRAGCLNPEGVAAAKLVATLRCFAWPGLASHAGSPLITLLFVLPTTSNIATSSWLFDHRYRLHVSRCTSAFVDDKGDWLMIDRDGMTLADTAPW